MPHNKEIEDKLRSNWNKENYPPFISERMWQKLADWWLEKMKDYGKSQYEKGVGDERARIWEERQAGKIDKMLLDSIQNKEDNK